MARWLLTAACTVTGPAGEQGRLFTVGPHGGRAHTLIVRESVRWVTVQGSDVTDLDCWVFDDANALVDSDTDGTSCCVLRIRRPGPHRLMIENMGGRSNSYRVRQWLSLPRTHSKPDGRASSPSGAMRGEIPKPFRRDSPT